VVDYLLDKRYYAKNYYKEINDGVVGYGIRGCSGPGG
jgi:hypothetical protein